MEAVIGLAGVLITGLFAVIAVLLKIVLSRVDDAKENLAPLGNGFAVATHQKLDRLSTTQNQIRSSQSEMKDDISTLQTDVSELRSTDETLLELITERRERDEGLEP